MSDESSKTNRRPWFAGEMPGGLGGWIILYSLMAGAYLVMDQAADYLLRMVVG